MDHPSLSRTVQFLGGFFLLEFLLLAIAPKSRATWLLENVLGFALAAALIASWRSFRLSRVSYIQLLLFLCVHEVGAHYTYSLVPYNEA